MRCLPLLEHDCFQGKTSVTPYSNKRRQEIKQWCLLQSYTTWLINNLSVYSLLTQCSFVPMVVFPRFPKRARVCFPHWSGTFMQVWIHSREPWCGLNNWTETHFLRCGLLLPWKQTGLDVNQLQEMLCTDVLILHLYCFVLGDAAARSEHAEDFTSWSCCIFFMLHHIFHCFLCARLERKKQVAQN